MARVEETGERWRLGLHTETLMAVHLTALMLAATTGVIHLYLYAVQGWIPFLLAGLGFFGAIALVLIDFYRRLVYLALVPYTLAMIAGWIQQGMPDFELGVFDKAVQLLLIALLIYLFFADRETEPKGRIEET